VAVVLSIEEYRRIAGPRPSFAEAYEAWRKSVDREALDVGPAYFAALREQTAGAIPPAS